MPRSPIEFPYPEDDFFDEGLPKGVLSPSGFSTYLKCPRQFEYAYIFKKIRPPKITMIRGTAIHRGAEVVHNNTIKEGKPLGLEESTQEVADTFEAEASTLEDVPREEKDAGKDSAVNGFTIYYREAVPLIDPVAAEKPFAMKIGTVPFRGVIDLIDRIPGEYTVEDDPNQPPPKVEVVSDLKTTKQKWAQNKIDKEPQLTFYSMVEDTERVRVDMLITTKTKCRYLPQRSFRGTAIKRRLVEDVEAVADMIKKGCFPRCDPTHWVCSENFCGYSEDCMGPK